MIHVVTSENRCFYEAELASMRALRDEQRETKTGWIDLVVVGDAAPEGPGTIHLLAFDEAMRLEAALRLDPTLERCLLTERFAAVIAPDEPPKVGRETWQAADLFTTAALRAQPRTEQGARVAELWTAAIEMALINGVERLVGVIDMALYPGVLNMPLDARLVGTPRPYPMGLAAGMELALSPALCDRLRDSLGLVGPSGYHVDDLDLRAFSGLANIQRQVIRAQVPQLRPGAARDETLAAATLYRFNDSTSQDRDVWAERGVRRPSERLNA